MTMGSCQKATSTLRFFCLLIYCKIIHRHFNFSCGFKFIAGEAQKFIGHFRRIHLFTTPFANLCGNMFDNKMLLIFLVREGDLAFHHAASTEYALHDIYLLILQSTYSSVSGSLLQQLVDIVSSFTANVVNIAVC